MVAVGLRAQEGVHSLCLGDALLHLILQRLRKGRGERAGESGSWFLGRKLLIAALLVSGRPR